MNRIERILSNFVGFRSKKQWKQWIAGIYYLFALSFCFAGFYGTVLSVFFICIPNFLFHFASVLLPGKTSAHWQVTVFASVLAFSTACLFLLPPPAFMQRDSQASTAAVVPSVSMIPAAPPAVQSQAPAVSSVDEPLNERAVVYVTSSGKKYHREGCSFLSHSAKSITEADARQKGYTPCKRCCP